MQSIKTEADRERENIRLNRDSGPLGCPPAEEVILSSTSDLVLNAERAQG
ncbi:hypothetical protein F2P79_013284, partial [Pimephales promelas]